MSEYVPIKTDTLTEWADEMRRIGGTEDPLSTAQMLELLSTVKKINDEEPGAALPEKVVYYNNMNGYEYSKIKVNKLSYDGSATTILDDFDVSDTWGESRVVRMVHGTHGESIAIQQSHSNFAGTERFVDNGYGSADCPGFTIGGWFRKIQNTSTYERALYLYGTKTTGIYLPSNSNTTIYFEGQGNTSSTGFTIKLNSWYHFALSVEPTGSGSVKFTAYINGAQVASRTESFTINFTSVFICYHSDYPWAGDIKNVFATWGALTAEEIRQMMLRD